MIKHHDHFKIPTYLDETEYLTIFRTRYLKDAALSIEESYTQIQPLG